MEVRVLFWAPLLSTCFSITILIRIESECPRHFRGLRAGDDADGGLRGDRWAEKSAPHRFRLRPIKSVSALRRVRDWFAISETGLNPGSLRWESELTVQRR